MLIQWYPGHMAKAKRQLADKLKQVDLVIEVLDARAPQISLNPDLEDMFKDKAVLYVLNKTDLADPNVTARWLEWFKSQGKNVCKYSAAADKADTLRQQIEKISQPIVERFEQKGMRKTIRGMVTGIPNVGKSAILNRLVGAKQLKEANKPGVTRSLQWAKIGPYLELLDSPGMLWPKFDDERTGALLALIGCVPMDVINEEELACYLISFLASSEPNALEERYGVSADQGEPYEVLEAICKRRGFLIKGGEYDTERGARTLLDEFRGGKLGKLSLEVPS